MSTMLTYTKIQMPNPMRNMSRQYSPQCRTLTLCGWTSQPSVNVSSLYNNRCR